MQNLRWFLQRPSEPSKLRYQSSLQIYCRDNRGFEAWSLLYSHNWLYVVEWRIHVFLLRLLRGLCWLYVSYMSNCGGPISRYSSFCVGYTEDSETLQYDPSSQSYTCDGLPVSCSVANAVSKSTSILSLVSTWAGLLCWRGQHLNVEVDLKLEY